MCFAVAACAAPGSRAPQEVLDTLAPAGKVRIGINVANPALAKRDPATGEISGITVDLGRALARRLGSEPVLVAYPNPGQLIEGARKGEWDVGFAAVDPQRADMLAFTPAYMEVSLSYFVPAGSAIRTLADVDRAGVKVGVGERNAADLFLTRSLKHAELVRTADNLRGAADLLQAGRVNAFATNREGLLGLKGQMPGEILAGRFHVVQHAIALPKAKQPALPYVTAFVESVKSDGTVAQALERHGVRGVEVAPAAR